MDVNKHWRYTMSITTSSEDALWKNIEFDSLKACQITGDEG